MMLDAHMHFEVVTSKDFLDFYDKEATTIYHDIESDIYYILGEDFFVYYRGIITY